jgi:hypothetical protein
MYSPSITTRSSFSIYVHWIFGELQEPNEILFGWTGFIDVISQRLRLTVCQEITSNQSNQADGKLSQVSLKCGFDLTD